jgi:hypothetical protein
MMSYGYDNIVIRRRAASYVDRNFNGAKPGRSPVLLASHAEFGELRWSSDLPSHRGGEQ